MNRARRPKFSLSCSISLRVRPSPINPGFRAVTSMHRKIGEHPSNYAPRGACQDLGCRGPWCWCCGFPWRSPAPAASGSAAIRSRPTTRLWPSSSLPAVANVLFFGAGGRSVATKDLSSIQLPQQSSTPRAQSGGCNTRRHSVVHKCGDQFQRPWSANAFTDDWPGKATSGTELNAANPLVGSLELLLKIPDAIPRLTR
jgi:hypothetical protein